MLYQSETNIVVLSDTEFMVDNIRFYTPNKFNMGKYEKLGKIYITSNERGVQYSDDIYNKYNITLQHTDSGTRTDIITSFKHTSKNIESNIIMFGTSSSENNITFTNFKKYVMDYEKNELADILENAQTNAVEFRDDPPDPYTLSNEELMEQLDILGLDYNESRLKYFKNVEGDTCSDYKYQAIGFEYVPVYRTHNRQGGRISTIWNLENVIGPSNIIRRHKYSIPPIATSPKFISRKLPTFINNIH